MKRPFRRILSLALVLLLCLSLLPAQALGAFSDVEPGDWFYDTVTEMTGLGWLKGYPDGSFLPESPISCGEFVSLACRMMNLEPPQSGAHWASGCLAAGLERNWYDWDEIPPTGEKFDQPISRQLAAKILMKAMLPDVRGDYNTESAKIADFSQLDGRYYEPVLAAYAVGLVHGDDDGRFRPKDGMSRAEACTLLSNARKLAAGQPPAPNPSEGPDVPPQPSVTVQGGVSENGPLQVIGTQLRNARGEPIVLRGMSSHGLQWYSQFADSASIRATADYGANLFRAAMYTAEGGYITNPQATRQKLIQAVDAAIENDMYVIIDWHILSDGNPLTYVNQSKSFFDEISKRYKDSPAVLYEICNEPNGNVSWSRDIKPYAEQIISVIRRNDPDGVILVGSPTWSQDLHLAAADPLEANNIMYTCHFYAGTHGDWLRQRVDACLAQGLPVFVSEWGTSRADGSGGVFLQESAVWLDFLRTRGISWANWSLCDKGESSAALRSGASAAGGFSQAELSQSGAFVFSHFSD